MESVNFTNEEATEAGDPFAGANNEGMMQQTGINDFGGQQANGEWGFEGQPKQGNGANDDLDPEEVERVE